jgi:hypothetical protein
LEEIEAGLIHAAGGIGDEAVAKVFRCLLGGDGRLRNRRGGGGIVGAGGVEGQVLDRSFKSLQRLNVGLIGRRKKALSGVGGWNHALRAPGKALAISGEATPVLIEMSENSSSRAEVLESSAPSLTPASAKFR